MDDHSRSELSRLFGEAAAMSTNERQALVERTKRENPGLGQTLESLLEHYDAAQDEAYLRPPGPILAQPPGQDAPDEEGLAETRSATLDSSHPSREPPLTDGEWSHDGSPKCEVPIPDRIGRYRMIREIGSGGFAVVWKAHDEQLGRDVAIKVSRSSSLSLEEQKRFVEEARAAAELQHPAIVPVYDILDEEPFAEGDDRGGEGDAVRRVYIVQRFIDGPTLAVHLREHGRLEPARAAELVATIADAISHAHQQRLIHTDLKPANVLIEAATGKPVVADLGLAVHQSLLSREQDVRAGTPQYMAPEQIRGERHRLDGRTDIWALGVILFELLAGAPPFQGDTVEDLFDNILDGRPWPLRQAREDAPRELARICDKCLQLRMADRYATAGDLADDLRRWLRKPGEGAREVPSTQAPVVPHGLRSFTAADQDFYLQLLPGPRDHEGLPESIRFWKTRLDSTDPAESMPVGLIYGPSGCGKSSFVQAGLLPRLDGHVTAIRVEATARQTESLLRSQLRNAVPELADDLTLPECFAQLREGNELARGRKVVVILDQFEQWLHACGRHDQTALLEALRHCDGARVQCVLLVRDDFWLATSRFLQALEIPLVENENARLVDLFDPPHACHVLTEFGRAYGRLPLEGLTSEQQEFVNRSVEQLSTDGRVICVRLSLFAEMVKSRDWEPRTLQQLGGIEGLGVTFLEEAFSASTAPPANRHYQSAARSVLESLLPEPGTQIKGHVRSRQELAVASNHPVDSPEFELLLQILDGQLRLITPVDEVTGAGQGRETELPDGEAPSLIDGGDPGGTVGGSYQLTHDYLVPPLREWLNRKRKETRRGRAELRLQDRTAMWKQKPSNRHLPSIIEFAGIYALTRRRNWNTDESRMMRRAGRVHGIRSAAAALLLLFLVGVIYEMNGRVQADALVRSLIASDADGIERIVDEMPSYRRWVTPRLRDLAAGGGTAEGLNRQQLHARLALAALEDADTETLVDALLEEADFAYVGAIRERLDPRAASQLWAVLEDESRDAGNRFRAALALALLDPDSNRWKPGPCEFVADQLVRSNSIHQVRLWTYLDPVSRCLTDPLAVIFREHERSDTELEATANALVAFAGDEPELLGRLILDGTPAQYAILFDAIGDDEVVDQGLLQVIRTQPLPETDPMSRIELGQRRATAAITLLRRAGIQEPVFETFHVKDDPESLTQFVHRSRERGITPEVLLDCLDRADTLRQQSSGPERDAYDRVVFGILLSLGEFDVEELPQERRDQLIRRIAGWYGTDPDSRIHGASGWLLRQWDQARLVIAVDETPIPYSEDREWFTLKIDYSAEVFDVEYTDSLFMTFVVIPAGDYWIGSPEEEPFREREVLRRVTMTRPLAVCDSEVTWIQYNPVGKPYFETFEVGEARSISLDEPACLMSWFEAIEYARWLTEQRGLPESEQCYPDEPTVDEAGAPVDWQLTLGGQGFRLPTEAEWEIACRGGTRTAYSYGNMPDLLTHYGWYQENSATRSHVVRSRRPSPHGLFDMHGNLREWCHDFHIRHLVDEAPEVLVPFFAEQRVDPTGPDLSFGSNARVERGGSWLNAGQFCRSANRSHVEPANHYDYVGFRLVFNPALPGESEQ